MSPYLFFISSLSLESKTGLSKTGLSAYSGIIPELLLFGSPSTHNSTQIINAPPPPPPPPPPKNRIKGCWTSRKISGRIKIKKTDGGLVLTELVDFHETVQNHYETHEGNWLILITEN